MNHTLASIILVSLFLNVRAQLNDDFNDGNLTSNPAWEGDIASFIVNGEGLLQLNAPEAGSSFIHTALALPDTAEWMLFFRMTFAPSTSNLLRVYLILDSPDPGTANGYFVEIGENGSADALRLFRLDNGNPVEIGSGPGLFGGDPSSARMRITRDRDGLWNVSADLAGGTDFTNLFSATDATHANAIAQRFGISCVYTDTRRDRFFFDDIYAGGILVDATAPGVTGITVPDANHVQVDFNEPLGESALEPDRYTISSGIGQPQSVIFNNAQQTSILLTTSTTFTSGTDYTLHVNGVSDATGNALDTTLMFSYFVFAQPDRYDILINEMMADPAPVVGLPDAEYLELYNISAEAFQLSDYALTVGTQTVLLPEIVLPADGFIVLADADDISLFQGIPNVRGINLPALTNSGTTLELSDQFGNPLHSISYDLSSYQDPARDDGGWSLELINPLAPCAITGNLRASQDLTGGTPGMPNSVSQDPVADSEGPVLERITPRSMILIDLIFDETINASGYDVSLSPDHFITGFQVDDNILQITLQTPLLASTLYTLTVHTIADCLGNVRANQFLTLGLPEPAGPNEIKINEILFDPGTGGSRFIELINTSFSKFIDVSELVVADIQGDTVAAFPVSGAFLLHPGDVVALSPDIQDLRTRYPVHDPAQLVQTEIPAFDRSEGNATIYTRSGIVLDVFDYSEELHNTLLDDTRGVSLERISTTLPTQSAETWYSAAGAAGFATPGMPNSQHLPNIAGDGVIQIEPETFSPDGDGFDDFLTLRFISPPPGAVANVRVYDAHGREIFRLAEGVSVGAGSVLRWEGVNSNGERARVGPHVIWVELFNGDGTVEHYKRACVVAERL